ncbi:MAG: DUF1634 domain-containing protein [Desulfoferrobacter sp.]
MAIKLSPKALPHSVAQDLENKNHKVSMLISIVALGLMAIGFVATVMDTHHMMLPGTAALPLAQLISAHSIFNGLPAMTIGVILLAFLPTARILWAVWIYFKSRNFLDVAVAIVVLLELFFSTHMGR